MRRGRVALLIASTLLVAGSCSEKGQRDVSVSLRQARQQLLQVDPYPGAVLAESLLISSCQGLDSSSGEEPWAAVEYSMAAPPEHGVKPVADYLRRKLTGIGWIYEEAYVRNSVETARYSAEIKRELVNIFVQVEVGPPVRYVLSAYVADYSC